MNHEREVPDMNMMLRTGQRYGAIYAIKGWEEIKRERGERRLSPWTNTSLFIIFRSFSLLLPEQYADCRQ